MGPAGMVRSALELLHSFGRRQRPLLGRLPAAQPLLQGGDFPQGVLLNRIQRWWCRAHGLRLHCHAVVRRRRGVRGRADRASAAPICTCQRPVSALDHAVVPPSAMPELSSEAQSPRLLGTLPLIAVKSIIASSRSRQVVLHGVQSLRSQLHRGESES